jgi:hypothetical protein
MSFKDSHCDQYVLPSKASEITDRDVYSVYFLFDLGLAVVVVVDSIYTFQLFDRCVFREVLTGHPGGPFLVDGLDEFVRQNFGFCPTVR